MDTSPKATSNRLEFESPTDAPEETVLQAGDN